MGQCWLVVSSQAARERAAASITKAPQRAWAAIEQPRWPVHANRCETPEAAPAARTARSTAGRAPQRDTSRVLAHKRYAGTGRPTAPRPIQATAWQRQAQVRPAQEVMEAHKQQRACVVMGTTMPASHVTDAAVLHA